MARIGRVAWNIVDTIGSVTALFAFLGSDFERASNRIVRACSR